MRYAHVSDRRGSMFPFTTHTHKKMHEECQTSTTKKGFNCEKTSFLQASNLDRCEQCIQSFLQ